MTLQTTSAPPSSGTFISQLAAIGALAPSADNTQAWRMNWNGEELSISYAGRNLPYNVFTSRSHATLLSVGTVMENLQLALDQNGVAATWRWGTADGQPYAAVKPETLPVNFSVPQAAVLRHTNRLPYRADPLPADLVARMESRSSEGNRLSFMVDRASKSALVKLVRSSSEARFCNEELHKWLFGSLRHTPAEVAQGDGLDLATLGLPPGGKQFLSMISSWPRLARLNRLGAYKLLALTEVALISAAPCLVCIVGAADDRSVIDAGRLMERTWMELNLQGLAVQPYYVVTDQLNRLHAGSLAPGFELRMGEVERKLGVLLGLQEGEILHMILRVGYPLRQPVRSRRLALAAVFADSAGNA